MLQKECKFEFAKLTKVEQSILARLFQDKLRKCYGNLSLNFEKVSEIETGKNLGLVYKKLVTISAL